MIRVAGSLCPARPQDFMKQKLLATIFVAGFSLGFVACDKPAPVAPPTANSTNAPAKPAAPRPEFQKLTGKWERPDGGYVLEIKGVDAEGKVDASYSNPSPIKVSRARAYREGETTKVFVELTDVNYPGCTYQLTLDEKNDQLFGTYFQAALQQTFDVAFARLK